MKKYRTVKYKTSLTGEGYSIQYKSWTTLWRWKLLRGSYGGTYFSKNKQYLQDMITEWTEKPQITPITETKG